jgi:hypothetical protein
VDDQAIFSESEAGFQRAVYILENIANGFNHENKNHGIPRKNHIRCKIVIDNKTIEQV